MAPINKTQPSYIIGKHFLQSTEFMKYSPTGPYIECHILFLSLISIYIIYFYVLCVIYSHSPTVTDIRYRDKAWGGECWNHSSALCYHPLFSTRYQRPPLDRSTRLTLNTEVPVATGRRRLPPVPANRELLESSNSK